MAVNNVCQRMEGSALVVRPHLYQVLVQLRQVLELLDQ